MRLIITTPGAVAVDQSDVVAVRAEDESGSFGILSGHTEFLTVLTMSVVSWRRSEGLQHHCAVSGGVLTVRSGSEVAIATRQAVVGDDLDHLETVVLAEFRNADEAERSARVESVRLHVQAVRHILRYLRPQLPPTFGEGA